MKNSDLHVVGAYSNPRGFPVRAALAQDWIKRNLETGVSITFVEHAFGRRPFLYEPGEGDARFFDLVQIRGGSDQELWLKEPMLNRGMGSVFTRHPDAKDVVWGDTDIEHLSRDWVRDTQDMLEHNAVGQTWVHSIDRCPKGNVARNEWGNDVDRSACAAWVAGDVVMPEGAYGQAATLQSQVQSRDLFRRHGPEWDARCHYGYEWAGRGPVLQKIGGLIPWLITGSGDYNMFLAFAGIARQNVDHQMSAGYVRRLAEYAKRCDDHVRQDIGVVNGTIVHHWHGRKKDRQYLSRQEILVASKFDPDVDIVMDVHGLPTLCTDNRILRDGLRRYNLQRNEQSVDL